jgi:hypothetical protein
VSKISPPIGYNDAGEPIETVTVTASRLPDWWMIALLAAIALAAFDIVQLQE